MIDIGKMIAHLRRERKMSQEALAEQIGCTKQTVSNYERNSRRPDYETILALSDIFNVPVNFFLTKEEQDDELAKIYSGYNIKTPVDTLYISKPSGDADIDELRKSLHEFIDSLSNEELKAMSIMIKLSR